MDNIPTDSLMDMIIGNKGKIYEISLMNGYYNSTHNVWYGGKLIYDMEINLEVIHWHPCEFAQFYRNAVWKIENFEMSSKL
jgi:hypothetical protein